MTRECEIAGCGRDAETDVPATDRDGGATVLVVCEPCHNAYMSGAKDPSTQGADPDPEVWEYELDWYGDTVDVRVNGRPVESIPVEDWKRNHD